MSWEVRVVGLWSYESWVCSCVCCQRCVCVCDGTFKIWISPGCFYTRTPQLTLLKVSLRWETLSLSSATQWNSLFLSFCMSVTLSPALSLSLSLHSTLTTLLDALSALSAPCCKPKTARRGERRRDTWLPFAIRSSRIMTLPLAHFTCMSQKMKSENANFCRRFPDQDITLNLNYLNMV